MSSHRTGCTLVELLLAGAFLFCGVATAVSGGDRFGAVGYVGGFVLGIVGSVTNAFLPCGTAPPTFPIQNSHHSDFVELKEAN